jgi:hypothetical protein
MKKIIIPLACLLLPVLQSNAHYDTSDFAKLFPLQGTWKTERRSGSFYEVWQKQNDSTLTAFTYRIKDNDTTKLETVVLSLRNGKIVYSPTTINQNNQQPVDFNLVQIAGGRFDFENKAHDFPQLISYEVRNGDSLYASISGPTPNGNKTIPYNYARVK